MRSKITAPRWREGLRQRFWLLPASGMVTGLVLGFVLVEVDYRLDINPWAFTFVDLQSARNVLATIATVTVSVAGLAFSVTVVSLQLASQQLSPRVLRTFQGDRLSQLVLAAFVGTFVFALIVLAKLTEQGVPALSVTTAILGAIVSFGLFVAFIHHIIVSLKASTILKRISRDGRAVVERRWPAGLGQDADEGEAQAALHRLGGRPSGAVRSERAGYLTTVDGDEVLRLARRGDWLVRQRVGIGEFALTGGVLADVWGPRELSDEELEGLRGCFELADERSVVLDVSYPVRQLADVALRALSPSLNDPTTAENAVRSMADLIVLLSRAPDPAPVRADDDGTARLVTDVATFDDIVRVGFEQIRDSAVGQPVFARRVVRLLGELADIADSHGRSGDELREQARLLAEGVGRDGPVPEDVERVRRAYQQLSEGAADAPP